MIERERLRVLVAGCGYVGSAFAERMAAEGHHVVGIRRSTGSLPPAGVDLVAADLTDESSLRAALSGHWNVVVYAASAGGRTEEAYRRAYVEGPRALGRALGPDPSRRAILTSSTGVYAQDSGAWVDESSATEPTDPYARILLEGESAFAEGPWSATVLRLGGIYGPGRTRLVDRVRSGEARRTGTAEHTNRIHRDDASAAVAHLVHLPEPEPIYLGVDEEPATMDDVLSFLAEELGVAPPPLAPPQPSGRSGRGNKRCRSDRLRASGFTFRYPSFREGYRALIG